MTGAAAEPVPPEPEPHDYYGVPLWMMKEYLAQVGASEVRENVFAGLGWQVVLERAPWRHVGSLRVGGTRARFSGDAAALDTVFERLHWKTQRGGG